MFKIVGRFYRACFPSGQYARDLAMLVSASREERQALSAMLTDVTVGSRQLTQLSAALQQVEADAIRARQELDSVTAKAAELQQTQDAGANVAACVTELAEELLAAVRLAAQDVARLDEQAQQRRDAVQHLSSRLQEGMSAIETVTRRVSALEHATRRLAVVPRTRVLSATRIGASARSMATVTVAAACLLLAYVTFEDRQPPRVTERTLAPSTAAAVRSSATTATIVPAVLEAPAVAATPPRVIEQTQTRRLAPPATEGVLRVTSVPSGARVTVNGIGWGSTPVTIRHLSLGEKDIRLTKDGYLGQERTTRLTATAPERSVEVSLRPNRGTAMRTVALLEPQEVDLARYGSSQREPVPPVVDSPATSEEVAAQPRSTTPVVVRGARTLWRGVTKVFGGR